MQCLRCGKGIEYDNIVELNGKAYCASCFALFAHKTCPTCMTTIEDFRRTALLGCADCYIVFRDEILKSVRTVQGEARHRGIIPSGASKIDYESVFEADELKKKLELALREGDYAEVKILQQALKAKMAPRGKV